jgi:DNA-binding NtrC family response regulator
VRHVLETRQPKVAEIPPEVQAKLLRFLQFGEIQPVGSDRAETLDVRVVAATHADLGDLARQGRFRQDLYFRLKVLELRIPPLRERPGDVPLLLGHFLAKHWRRPDARPRLSPRALRAFSAYRWPGNVRELEHVVQRACLLAGGPELAVDLLPEELEPKAPAAPAGPELTELTNEGLKAARDRLVLELEVRFVEELMQRHGGNVSRAAREAHMHRSYLQKLLARRRGGS